MATWKLKRGKCACFSGGHGKDSRRSGSFDPGAVYGKRQEAVLNLGMAYRLGLDFARLGWKVLVRDAGPYYTADDEANAFGASVFIEFHWDAGPRTARGASALVAPDAPGSERSLGYRLCRAAERIGIENDGVKERGDLAVLKQYPQMDTVLFEQGYITSWSDRKALDTNVDQYEFELVNAILTNYGYKPVTSLPRQWSNLRSFLYRLTRR